MTFEWSWLNRNKEVKNGTHQLTMREDSSNLATLVDDEVATLVMNGNDVYWSSTKVVDKTHNVMNLLRFGDANLGESETDIIIEWTRIKNRLFKNHWKNLIVPLIELVRSEFAVITREIGFLNYIY